MTSAPDLLRGVGLLADGPVLWGRPISSARSGVFLVELPAPLPSAPIDAAVCGKWAERVTTLRLDGERPNGLQLARRLAAFWLPSQTVVYLGSTEKSLSGRIGALYATELGDRRPHSGGHWLKTLRGLAQARIWWAESSAPAEAELELAIAFAESVDASEAGHLPDPAIVLPFANLEDPLGARKPHGLAASLLALEPPTTAPPSRRAAETPDTAPRSASAPRAGRAPSPGKKAAGAQAPTSGRSRLSTGGRLRMSVPPKPSAPAGETIHVTAAGLDRMQVELGDLLAQRPAVVNRIRSARELGDLRENSEYQEARREQSFLEGRIQALEATLRGAVVAEEAGAERVALGSTVVVESVDGTASYTLVGPREADARSGRVSTSAPIGQALLGRRAGDDVVVSTPAGERHFRILEIGATEGSE
ncbi:MAG TPA: GreA/GreB family elongation factor [Candidatus Limnocylindrales bacterium]